MPRSSRSTSRTGQSRVFASGLRNPVGMAWEPQTGELWAVVNERDELGSDLVPDYLTSVKDGAFYGWPFSYYGQHVDTRVKPQNPGLVAKAIVPDYALGNHVAPLGLTFARGSMLPEPYTNGAFIGEHGSWNRNPRSGYKVVFVPFVDGQPAGKPVDVLTGFVSAEGDAHRPSGRGRNRQVGGAAGRRRCRQCRLAGRPGRAIGCDEEVRQARSSCSVLSCQLFCQRFSDYPAMLEIFWRSIRSPPTRS